MRIATGIPAHRMNVADMTTCPSVAAGAVIPASQHPRLTLDLDPTNPASAGAFIDNDIHLLEGDR